MVWRSTGAILALLGLLLCSGNAFATVVESANLYGGTWLHNWGTLETLTGYDGTDTHPGTRLFPYLTGATEFWSEDYIQESEPIPSPNGPTGEYWDAEFLAYSSDANNYYFLGILSTSFDLYMWDADSPIAVGDLAINQKAGGSISTGYYAEYGVKLAGTNAEQTSSGNVQFGWGIAGTNSTAWELRNPEYTNTYQADGGFYPGQSCSYADPYDWASNFTWASGGTPADVEWHKVLGASTPLDSDGPGSSTGKGYETGLDTWAFEVKIAKAALPTDFELHNFSYASSCLNDGMTARIGSGGKVPELPPTLLAVMLPAIGLLVRRMKSR